MTVSSVLFADGFVFSTLLADLLTLAALAYMAAAMASIGKYMAKFHYTAKIVGGPKSHWLLGDSVKYGYTHQGLMNSLERIEEFPAMCTQYMGWFGHVQVYHPDCIKEILARSYPKSFMYKLMLSPLLRDGLLVSKGDYWKRHRRLLTPIFHFDILKAHVDVFSANSSSILELCELKSLSGISFDITSPLADLSFRNMMECVMSKKVTKDAEENWVYIQALKELSYLVFKRFTTPYLWPPALFFLSKEGKKFKKLTKEVEDEAFKLISERREILLRQNSFECNPEDEVMVNQETESAFTFRKRKGKIADFLDILIQTKDQEGKGLSDEEINEEVITFFSGGHETVSNGLVWTLYFLAKYPEHQSLCREEIRNVLGDQNNVNASNMSKLPYLTQCIKESMRMCPPIHMVARCISEDVTVSHRYNEFKEIKIPKGTNVAVNIWALHHHPDIWKNPEVFDPSRFSADKCHERSPYAFVPFGAGPRNCIGQHFGMQQMKVVLALMLRNYEFLLDTSHPNPSLIAAVVIQPGGGVHLFARKV
ncbi:cytochrome P450 4F3-like [Clavelina lepadiformis]|uniref:cytochrome P450 4F3-like n=1 Tax=Clavelina lepadiformis TaxID=159417 RepID=UPI0040411D72